MSFASTFAKKILAAPALAQLSFNVAVLDLYLGKSGMTVSRTETVGRLKTASWSVDFGIAPDEKSIHLSVQLLIQRLPESEHAHWLEHIAADRWSENFLKMQSAHACIDDGGYRVWGEESLF